MKHFNLQSRTLFILMLICSGLSAQTNLIPLGSSWNYYDDGDEPAGNWKDITYDDSGWEVGNAQLGYGDGDEATVINSTDASGGNLTTAYFRHEFNIDNVNALINFEINLTYDDGAIVYINGMEAVRLRLPSVGVTYNTYTTSQGTENGVYTFAPNAADFVTGTNVISVEVHQRSNTSSDISFDFRLEAENDPSFLDNISFGSDWAYYDAGNRPISQSGLNWTDSLFSDANWSTGTAEFGFGDGDEMTILNTVLSAYFRKKIQVSDVSLFEDFVFNIRYDDGYSLHVNGNEVKRGNIQNIAPLSYGSAAGDIMGDNAMSSDTIPASYFVTGENTIAFSIHEGQEIDLSFDLEMTGILVPIPADIIRGPYLQKGTESSVVVKWRTDIPAQSVVNYGASLGNLTSVASNTVLTTEHEVEITGLTDATKYFYSVSDQNYVIVPEAADLYFKTHPVPGVETPLRAWILGDPGTANQNQRNVRDAYYGYTGADHTDMMLFLGDNAYGSGTDAQYQDAMFENMYEEKMKNTIAWSTLGNHDGYSASSISQTGPYYEIFTFPKAAESGGVASGTEAYYSFDYGDTHFIVLDSNDSPNGVGGAMYLWAETDIQSTTAKWIVAMFHHPPYTKGSHDSDLDGDSGGRLKAMRKNFLPMLEANGIDLVLSGHSHSYERSFFINGHYGKSATFDPNTHFIENGGGDGRDNGDGKYSKNNCSSSAGEGAVYITTGSAGKVTGNGSLDHNAMYYSKKDLGSTVLEIDGNELSIKFVRPSGAIDDYFTISKADVLAGDPCDDGLACTTDDMYDAACGCAGTPVDSDGDQIDDCTDACPNDPNKILPGTCGCGVAETDLDGDGTKDCIDDCPNDNMKTAPGQCGCGNVDIDTDNDGICDDIDDCVLLIHVNPFNMTDTTYEVIETITSDALLNSGLNMNFSAGKEIELQTNFEVKTGSTFHAYIEGCNN